MPVWREGPSGHGTSRPTGPPQCPALPLGARGQSRGWRQAAASAQAAWPPAFGQDVIITTPRGCTWPTSTAPRGRAHGDRSPQERRALPFTRPLRRWASLTYAGVCRKRFLRRVTSTGGALSKGGGDARDAEPQTRGTAMAGAHARAPRTRRGGGAAAPEPQSESGRGCSQEDGWLGPQLGARQLPAGRLPRPDGTAAPSQLAVTLGTRGPSASTPGQNLGSEHRDRPQAESVRARVGPRSLRSAHPPGPRCAHCLPDQPRPGTRSAPPAFLGGSRDWQ